MHDDIEVLELIDRRVADVAAAAAKLRGRDRPSACPRTLMRSFEVPSFKNSEIVVIVCRGSYPVHLSNRSPR